jgi:hypothetical protein
MLVKLTPARKNFQMAIPVKKTGGREGQQAEKLKSFCTGVTIDHASY